MPTTLACHVISDSAISPNQLKGDRVLSFSYLCQKLKTWGASSGYCLFGSRLHINDDMSHISEFKKTIADMDLNVESSISTAQLNTDIVVAKA
ncbi:unnamed protein product [Lactuca virosa]|uniref:Uncharacterized protein n=1 Tax=Lactuca virosa TaxID=75947 RepID=A0AAU9PPU4_9ASTR|nr:unnamed protein product [Lactuca virosa]